MIRAAFLEEAGHGRMEPEIRDLLEELRRRGIPADLFTRKRLLRRRLPVTRDTLVAGYIGTVLAALKQLGVEVPEPNDYPQCLRPFLRRRVWQLNVRRFP
jgi:hypothetical protein